STATITIEGRNDAPVVSAAISETTNEDEAAFSIDLLQNASDADISDSLTVSNLTETSGNDAGGVTLNGNSFDVDPSHYGYLAVGESVELTYTYDVEDGNGGVTSSTATITIEGRNDAPVVSAAISETTNEDEAAFSIDLLQNASDADTSDALNVSNVSETSGNDAGGVTINGNQLDVSPEHYGYLAVGESVELTYSYDVVDNNGGIIPTTATITIEGRNDAPIVSAAISETTNEDEAAFSIDLLQNASDADTSDSLNVSNVSETSGNDAGGVTLNGDSFDVDPSHYGYLAVGESVELTYTYDVEDGNGGVTSTTATITIEGRNDAPVVSAAISETTNEDEAAFSIDLLQNASDADTSDSLNVSNVSETSGNDAGGVTLNGNSFDVDPSHYGYLAVGESVELTYTYDVEDGNGGITPTTATITIEGRNDAPEVSAAISETTNEDEAAFSIDLLQNASDVDTSDSLNVSNVSETSGNDAGGVTLNGNAFDVDPSHYGYLAVGESVELTYTYDVEDGNGGVTSTTATITIEGRNDAPLVSAAISETTNEDKAAFSIDLLQNASDADTSDSLNVNNVSETSGNDAGGVTLNGNSFDVDPSHYGYLAAGESVELSYTYDVEDGNGGVTPTTATITIEGRNDAPEVSAAISETTNEDEAAFSIDLLQNASDVDTADSLNVSNVTETSGNDAGGVTLNGNSFDVDPSHYGYLAVGESVELTYTYDVEDGNGGVTSSTATITIEGRNDAPVVSAAISETTNEDEAAFSIDLLQNASDADTSDSLNVSNVAETSGNDAGGVTLNGNAFDVDPSHYDYLAVGESIELTYTYDVEDGNGGVISSTATITIEGRNDSPEVSAAISETTNEDEAAFSIDLLQNASDVDTTDVLATSQISETSGNDAGGVTINGNQLDVSPEHYGYLAVGESVELSYSYDVIDNNGGITPTTATITIEGRNDAPVVSAAISETTNEDEAAFSIDLLQNASDADTSDSLNVSNVSETSGNDAGGVTLNGNAFDVDPSHYGYLAVGESVDLTYTYDVEDGNGGVTSSTATITIEGRNDAPVVSAAISETTNEDEEAFSIDLLQNASDADTSDSLTVSNVTETSGNDAGGVTLNGNSFDVDPSHYGYLAVGESVELTYTYDVEDGNGGVTSSTASITIEGRNDAPEVSAAISETTNEDEAAFSIDLLKNASDVDTSDSLNVSNVSETSGNDASGVTLNGNSFDVDPSHYGYLAAGESVELTYTYDVEDGNGGVTSSTATITIEGRNDVPVVSAAIAETTNEDEAAFSIDLLQNTTDVDNSDTLSVTDVVELSNDDAGGVSLNGNTFDVDPSYYSYLAQGESITLVYSYNVSDGMGGSVATTASITIEGRNDLPVIGSAIDVITNEDAVAFSIDLLDAVTDPDSSDTLSVSNVQETSGNDAGGVSIDGDQLDVDPDYYDYLALGEKVELTYVFDVEDGNGGIVSHTANVTIEGRNDAPIITGGLDSGLLIEDVIATASGTLTFTDVDVNDVHSWSVSNNGQGNYGALAFVGNTWTYTLDAAATQSLFLNQVVTETFTVTVSDGNGGTASTDVAVNIIGTNDVPLVQSGIAGTIEEDPANLVATGTLQVFDPDEPDNTSFSQIGNSAGTYGDFAIDASGNWSYTLRNSDAQELGQGETFEETFLVQIQDDYGAVVIQQVTVTVEGKNDNPVVTGQTVATVKEDTTLSATGDLDWTDLDQNDTHTWSVSNTPADPYGSLTIDDEGTWVYNLTSNGQQRVQQLGEGVTETETFQVAINDGNGGITTQDITITIEGTNDVPLMRGNLTRSVTEDANRLSVSRQMRPNDVDVGDSHTWTVEAEHPDSMGSFIISANGRWTFTLDNNDPRVQALAEGQRVQEFFDIKVTDQEGASTTKTVTITIIGNNDRPDLSGDLTGSVTEDTATSAQGTLASGDVDTADTHEYSVANPRGQYGRLTVDEATGEWVYTLRDANADVNALAEGETLTDTFRVRVVDDNNATSQKQLTITIHGSNDQPTIEGDVEGTVIEARQETATGQLVAVDVDTSDTHTWPDGTLQGVYGTLTIDETTGEWTYLLNSTDPDTAALKAGEVAQDVFSVTVDDGNTGGTNTQTVTINVVGTNTSPDIVGENTGTIKELSDSTATNQITGQLESGDPDNDDAHTWRVLDSTGVYGTLTVDDNGLWTYTLRDSATNVNRLDEGDIVSDAFTIETMDSNGEVSSEVVTITIEGTNDSPQITSQTVGEAIEDSAPTVSGQLSSGDPDQDAEAFWMVVDTDGTYGTFAIDADGRWTYNLYDNNSLAIQQLTPTSTPLVDTFPVFVQDQFGNVSGPQNFSVTITGTNDAPIVSGDISGEWIEDDTTTLTGTLVAEDVDTGTNDSVSFVAGTFVGNFGTLTVNADGTWSFDVDNASEIVQGLGENDTRSEVFQTFAVDQFGGVVPQSLTMTLVGRGDAPEIFGDSSGSVTEDSSTTTVTGIVGAQDQDWLDRIVSWEVLSPQGQYGLFAVSEQGEWTYLLDNDDPDTDALNSGETGTETFVIQGTDKDGLTDEFTVTITVNGRDDGTGGGGLPPINLDVSEDNVLIDSGVLSDANLPPGVTVVSFDPVPTNVFGAGFGDLTFDASSGQWVFSLDNSADIVQQLAEGETGEARWTISVQGSDGSTYQVPVNVDITGENDQPNLTEDLDGTVTEDGITVASGILLPDDVDSSDSHRYALVDDSDGDNRVDGLYGYLELNPLTGQWDYALDNDNPTVQALGPNDPPLVESFDVNIIDSSGTATSTNTAAITIDIIGTPDGVVVNDPVIETVEVFEDVTVSLSDTLTPPDGLGNNPTWTLVDGNGNYGALTLTSAGEWTYTLESGADNSAVNALNVGDTLTDTFSVAVVDEFGDTALDANGDTQFLQIVVTVNGTNDVPEISGQTSLTIENRDPDATVSGQLGVIDVDQNATAEFELVDGNGDPQTTLQGTYGVITLNPATGEYSYVLDDPAALENLGLNDAPLVESFDSRVIDDNFAASAITPIVIEITGTNVAPVITGELTVAVSEDDPATAPSFVTSGNLTLTDLNTSDTNLTFTARESLGVYGTFTIDSSGAWTYELYNDRPHIQELTPDDLVTETYTVVGQDEHGAQVQETITINITGCNDAPVLSGETSGAVSATSGVVTGELVTSDVDRDDSHTYRVDPSSTGSYGALSVDPDTGEWRYELDTSLPAYQQIAQGGAAQDTLNIIVEDSYGATDTIAVTVDIQGENDAPEIIGVSTGDVVEDDVLQVSGQLQSGDPDITPDADNHTWSVLDTSPYGELTIDNSGLWTFVLTTDNADVQALKPTDTLVVQLQVEVRDQHDAVDTETVEITITGTNDAPQISGDSVFTVTEDSAPTASGTVSSTDVDTQDTPAYSIGSAMYGSVSIDETSGEWTYVLDDANGDVDTLNVGDTLFESIVVTVTDEFGGTDTLTLDITIAGSNDAPQVSGVITEIATEDDAPFTIDLLQNVTDVDSNVLNVTNLTETTGGDTSGVTLVGNQLQVTPDAYRYLAEGDTLTLNYQFDVEDDNGGVTTSSAAIAIEGRNDAPIVSADIVSDVTQDDADFSLDLLANASDLEGDNLSVQNLMETSGNDAGGVTVNGDSLNISPDHYRYLNIGDSVTLTYEYEISDGNGGVITTSATITINGENDAPSITGDNSGVIDQTTLTSLTGTLAAVDEDTGDTFSWEIVEGDVSQGGSSQGLYGNLSLDDSGHWTYTVDNTIAGSQTLGEGESATDSFTVKVTDANGLTATQQIAVTVNGRNNAPTVDIADAVVTGRTKVGFAPQALGLLALLDVDNNNLGFAYDILQPDDSYADSAEGTYGRLTIDANGQWVYQIDETKPDVASLITGTSQTETFTLRATDTHGATVEQVVTVEVDGAFYAGTVSSGVDTIIATSENELLFGDPLGSNASSADTFVWETAALSNPAGIDIVREFDPNNDVIDLRDIVDTSALTSLDALGDILQFSSADGNVTLAVYDNGALVQSIVFEGINEEALLLVPDASGLSNAEKAELFISNGNLLGDNLGNAQSNTLQGTTGDDSLFGLGGNDILTGGEGSDLMSGGEGNDTFVWNTVTTATDTITDFEMKDIANGITDGDQLDISSLLPDLDGSSEVSELLNFIDASADDTADTITLAVTPDPSDPATTQQIELQMTDIDQYGISSGSSASEILTLMVGNDAFKWD
uniref:VCBS domain-containing protein n=1 Tax=Thaumasiovibrio occultus TaxID=1891184 RepID=UPI000B514167